MPSSLPRISAVMEPPAYYAIKRLADRDGVSLSQKARDLLLEALELLEDSGLEAIAQKRARNKAPSVSHAELKRRFRIR